MRKEIVTHKTFFEVLELLSKESVIAYDVETLGLSVHKDDVLFAMVLASECGCFYFHFDIGDDVPEDCVLDEPEYWEALRKFFLDPFKTWVAHHATFDLSFLRKEGIEVAGRKEDTKTRARILWNQHQSYSLKDVSKRATGLEKSDVVENYIKEHKLWTDVELKHKKTRDRRLHFDKVPFEIISLYTLQDGTITYELYKWQQEQFKHQAESATKRTPSPAAIIDLESRLIRPVFDMEWLGLKIDRKYCENAIADEECRASKASHNFFKLTGKTFMDSNKLFKEVFKGKVVPQTEKGNDSFDKDSLESMAGDPIADCILEYRKAKNQVNYFHGFLYHADKNDCVHPNLTRDATVTGRFSSSNPNFQNITRPDEKTDRYEARGAVVPRDGFYLFEFDYANQEMRLLLDLANETDMIEKIKAGLDPHSATAETAGVTRQQGKTLNFAVIYLAGPPRIAEMLGVTVSEAKALRDKYFRGLPNVAKWIKKTISDAEDYKQVSDWLGRTFRFPDRNDCYRAPNHVIQGGSSTITKRAICDVHDFLTDKMSRMVLTVHDSIVCEIHETELSLVPEIKKIMEAAYPHRSLPMKVTVEWSDKNLAETREYEKLER